MERATASQEDRVVKIYCINTNRRDGFIMCIIKSDILQTPDSMVREIGAGQVSFENLQDKRQRNMLFVWADRALLLNSRSDDTRKL